MDAEDVDETLDFIVDNVELLRQGKGGIHVIANIAVAIARLRQAFGTRRINDQA